MCTGVFTGMQRLPWCPANWGHWEDEAVMYRGSGPSSIIRGFTEVPLLVLAKKCLNNDKKMLIWAALVRTWPCRNSRGGFHGRRYPRDVIFIPERFVKLAGCRTAEDSDYGGGLLSFSPENVAMWQISIKKCLSQWGKPSQLIYVITPLPPDISSLTI